MAVLCAIIALPDVLAAQPFPKDSLPPELRPWIAWVLDEVPHLGCAQIQGRPICIWPGRLQLALSGSGGVFELAVHADRPADLRLPGDLERWPLDVRLDGRPAPVVDQNGAPTLRLDAGNHEVAGRFTWSRLPESLPVPAEVALLDLSLDGRRIAAPRREHGGLVWLGAQGLAAAGEGDSLRVQVFRKLADGIPLFVDTRLSLEVSGNPREVALAGALLDGAVPIAVRGDLPARLDAEQRLHVQLRGGRFTVSVLSRMEDEITELGPPERGGSDETEAVAWPEREIWVFQADEELRQVELAGAPPVDPSRTELPDEWHSLPAFLLDSDAGLELRETRRGQPESQPDRIQLAREIWLDLDGGGFTFRDRLTGSLNRSWRLDLLAPGALGRAAVDGQDQLLTAQPESGATGLELRRSELNLVADSRFPRHGSALHAVGWSVDVEQLRSRLHLPPGWSILGAGGVDQLPGTWTSRWTLLGFFFVLLVTFAVYRLLGWRYSLLALFALVFCHREPGAPSLVWLSLLGAMALRRVAPDGRLGSFARIWWMVSAGVLLLILAPFVRNQVCAALFPQVEPPRYVAPAVDQFEVRRMAGALGSVADKEELELQELATPESPPPPPAEPARVMSKRALVAQTYSYNVALEQEPHAVLQTGPGVPTWQWQTFSLTWSGPVSHEHRMRLFLASPGLNVVLTLVRLALLGLLAAVLLAWPRQLRFPKLGRKATATATLLGALLLPSVPAAAQEVPSREVLEELKRRLTRPEPCEPNCATTGFVLLRISDERLSFSVEVHAAARTTWRIPGPVSSWVPSQVRVDGISTAAVARLSDGFLHVRLDSGVHRLEIAGPTPPQDSFTLQFGDRPRRARAEAPGWDVVGFREDGPADASIQLTRRLRTSRAEGANEGVYAPWLEVTRTLTLGVSWQVTTKVRRVSPTGMPLALRVPLLPGESPTDARFEVEQGEVVVGLGRDDMQAEWISTLERTEQLTLTAPEGRPWSEVWRLQCSVVWQCEAVGLAPVQHQSAGVVEPQFRPWPGEEVSVTFLHPEGVEGQTFTLEHLELQVTPGVRLERVHLILQARSSREESLSLGLPEGVNVQEVTLDGAAQPWRPDAGRLRITLPAGSHRIEVRWHQERGMAIAYAVPRVQLPASAANAHLILNVPPNRWLLFVRDSAWGPSVLFWGYLIFALLVALVLGRIPGSPLTSRQWALLALGLSQISALGALIVAGFFLALAWRKRRPLQRAIAFDALQVGLVIWAIVTAVLLYQAIETGLLFRPDMQVAGNQSSNTELRWYVDRVAEATPAAGVLSLPLWVYRVAMLVWALWLASSLVRWVVWVWRAFTEAGVWRPLQLLNRKTPPPAEPPASPAPAGDSQV
jgi:hypothetical protein